MRFEWGDALALPYGDDSFDAATVGFGARNFADLAAALRRWHGWCGPADRVVLLEMTTPTKPPLSLFFGSGSTARAGARAAGGARARARQLFGGSAARAIADAYCYLPNSVKRFPAPPSSPPRWSGRASREITLC